ncbi:hypothetical protein EP10_000199 [Geobacillus icigianus]|uniref:Secreted protein n=1 Tax=Geobacillus icigianus TaxID=1430331 RepID=A0ABU6BBR7_9BACL|nr:hypothetical protein [Geobacillus icigianus]
MRAPSFSLAGAGWGIFTFSCGNIFKIREEILAIILRRRLYWKGANVHKSRFLDARTNTTLRVAMVKKRKQAYKQQNPPERLICAYIFL